MTGALSRHAAAAPAIFLISGAKFWCLIKGRLNLLFRTNGIGDRVISYSPELTMLLVTLAGVDDLQDVSVTEASLSSSFSSSL